MRKKQKPPQGNLLPLIAPPPKDSSVSLFMLHTEGIIDLVKTLKLDKSAVVKIFENGDEKMDVRAGDMFVVQYKDYELEAEDIVIAQGRSGWDFARAKEAYGRRGLGVVLYLIRPLYHGSV